MHETRRLFIGLMSGTSLDGVDGVLADFSLSRPQVLSAAYRPFPAALRTALWDLQQPGVNEIHREAVAAHTLAEQYHACVQDLLRQAACTPGMVEAIGSHGQTIRHHPAPSSATGTHIAYSRQMQNPALLAEWSGINVVADFRSRDLAAGGQGAPLVPAFHHAFFDQAGTPTVVCNIGGMANLSILPTTVHAPVMGFDCGPGNVLMDYWVQKHTGQSYDANGTWAATGCPHPTLLAAMRSDGYFQQLPPKSTGRDHFHPAWLQQHLLAFSHLPPQDVQATLLQLTATSIAADVRQHAPHTQQLIVCGGGAYNHGLMLALQQHLPKLCVSPSDTFGIPAQQVEALAFAWLAQRFCSRLPGNLPSVTGAAGLRILGAMYPR